MNLYAVPLPSNTLDALQLLTLGVKGMSVYKDLPTIEWPSACYLELTDGRFVRLEATSEDLEFKFEVFPLIATVKSEAKASQRVDIHIRPPVKVTPLLTESWLDPGAPTGKTLGSNPVAQFVGKPGTAALTASAKCRYVGAVEITGSNGTSIVVATGGFPFSMHVPGFYEDPCFRREDYVAYLGGA
jgi:hypothetical protein